MKKDVLTRNSSIELLRMVSLFMVLCLHANKDMVFANSFPVDKINYVFSCITEGLSIVAVNCFILITGYFSISSNKIKYRKVIDLVFLTSFYGVVIYAIFIAAGFESFGVKQLIKCVLPFLFDRVWFINVYIILYLLTPFINKVLFSLNKKQYNALLILLILLFSIWPSFFPNPPSNDKGYGIITFILVYSIGGYIRLHFNKVKKPFYYAFVYLLTAALLSLMIYEFGLRWGNYNNIFVIITSLMLFLFFRELEFKSSLINYISTSMIAVFIIHAHQSIRPHLFVDWFNLQDKLNNKLYFLYYFLCVIIIYVACIIIDIARRIAFKYSVDKIFDRIKLFNKTFELNKEEK